MKRVMQITLFCAMIGYMFGGFFSNIRKYKRNIWKYYKGV